MSVSTCFVHYPCTDIEGVTVQHRMSVCDLVIYSSFKVNNLNESGIVVNWLDTWTLKMAAAFSSEMLVTIYHHITEGSNLQQHLCENFISCIY